MKRYRFRLQQVLRVREIQEHKARGAVLLARSEVDVAAERVSLRQAAYNAHPSASSTANVASFQAERGMHDLRAASVAYAQSAELEATSRMQERIAEWSAAAQRLSALERLDERRRQEHALEALRDDERKVDDLVTSRWLRP